jgi:HlyD family secretion protein
MLDFLRAIFLGILAFFGLAHPGQTFYQGYGEGEYVLVAPQIAGTLEVLSVERGTYIHKGDVLFSLEHASEQDAIDRADATLTDLLKAKRQPELDTLIAQRAQAIAALRIAEINFDRDQKQIKVQAISQATFDADKATLDQAHARLTETEAALATGNLPVGRDDAIRAAQADVSAAQWKLDQKKRVAPDDAFVFDTLYRPGEFIKDGQPVVSLLPAANIKVRFFVPATKLAALPIGGKVMIDDNSGQQPLAAHITYISPQAEYSPPELYNRDNREKLLFMLEAKPDTTPERIHPGLPVDVIVNSDVAN